jgi:hypothetical protein
VALWNNNAQIRREPDKIFRGMSGRGCPDALKKEHTIVRGPEPALKGLPHQGVVRSNQSDPIPARRGLEGRCVAVPLIQTKGL